MTTLAAIHGTRADSDLATQQLYGIEVELENYRSAPPNHGSPWAITDDGSLRGNGVEFRSPRPWTMEQAVEAIQTLWQWIPEYGYRANVRTGIHVHANMLPYTPEQIGGVLAAYCILEPVLFRLCGQEREQNIYCVPWYRAEDEVDHAADFVRTGNMRIARRACKYSALYLEPLQRFGTIEFRHAPTYTEVEDMLLWLRVIDKLVLWGVQRDAGSVVQYYYEHEADGMLSEIFGPLATEIRSHCEQNVNAIVDEVDSVCSAEGLIEYEGPDAWEAPALYIQGDGHRGYWQRAGMGASQVIRPIVHHEDDPGYYDEEEFYDEEDF